MASRQYAAVLVAVVIAATLTGFGAWLTMPESAMTSPASGHPGLAISPSGPRPSASASGKTKPTKPPTKKPAPSKTLSKPRSPGSGRGPAGTMMYTGTTSVALTFDDGPDPVYTPQILDLLKKYHVHATFCVIGYRAAEYPSLIRRIVNEGHTLCNHSWQHLSDLGTRDDTYIKQDLQRTNDAIHDAVPRAKVKYFRAPYGSFTPAMVTDAAALGMKSIYWAIDPRDWDTPTFGTGSTMAAHVISEIETHIRQGSIILSHDGGSRSGTVLAYKTLVPWMLKTGYKLAGLPT
jgi:peptidoglycan/xylan/chitin deacetylase (PgdA/CDA1 family)